MITESQLRQGVLDQLRQEWPADSGALILEELGTHSGDSRVDIAVVNGSLWGFELKSSADRLTRLPKQSEAFSEVFDFAVLVAASSHLDRAVGLIPAWWGLIEAHTEDESMRLTERRAPRRNPSPNPHAVACLLWRPELVSILTELDAIGGVRSATRLVLVDRLVRTLPVDELGEAVRKTIKARQGWRVGQEPTLCDAKPQRANALSGFLAQRVRPPRPKNTGHRR